MSEQSELILRVEAKKKLIQAELAGLKNDVSKSTRENKKKLEDKISQMSKDIKVSGENFSETISKKLNDWLK